MNVAVTGATGFVGRATVAALAEAGLNPIPIVRTLTGLPNERVVGNVGPTTDWRSALKDCDMVVHLAARVHVMNDRTTDPLSEFRATNTAGTANLARQAQNFGVKRFIYVSSVKVLGEQTLPDRPFNATDPRAPQDPYAISKAEAEHELLALASSAKFETVVVRPTLVYGRGVGANFLTMMRWVASGVPLPLGGIQNARSMISVTNLASLLTRCCNCPAAAGGVFLASDGVDISTPSLLRQLASAMDRPARLIPIPHELIVGSARLLGMRKYVDRICSSLIVDSGPSRICLEWTPPLSLEQGIKETARHFLRSSNV
jgi:UDP-4-keto-D-QuiNAc 4-reductase